MSMTHYIASTKKLPLGEFGSSKAKICDINEKVKAIKFTSVQLPEDYVPLENIIDLTELDIKKNEIEIYETYNDAAGIYVQNIELQDEKIRKHFKNKFIYKVSPNWGKFFFSKELLSSDPQMYMLNKKCVNELFAYIRQNICENEEIEIYTCFINEECDERNDNLDMVIDLQNFNSSDGFELKEKQYVLVRE